jgi:hypothetical protein
MSNDATLILGALTPWRRGGRDLFKAYVGANIT